MTSSVSWITDYKIAKPALKARLKKSFLIIIIVAVTVEELKIWSAIMSNRWLTKQDVLNDLTEATGRRVLNIDERFAVRGERPPPVNVPDEDENEFLQINGQYVSKNSQIEQPDLCGITDMLRMVNDYYDSARCDDDINIRELKKNANTVFNISKLNPNVPEFVPKISAKNKSDLKNVVENEHSKNSTSSDCSRINKPSSKTLDIKDEMNKTDSSNKNEANNNDIDVTKKIDISSLNSNDIKDIREKLKQKIVDTSKDECLKKKRERNLAMASLLKLYTNIPMSPKINLPVKLITPDFYQTSPKDDPTISVNSETEQIQIEQNIKEDIKKVTEYNVNSKLRSNNTQPVKESINTESNSRESDIISRNKICEADVENQNNDFLKSKEVAESVKKVDKWLNGPQKKKHKSSKVFLGPVTFKRKSTSPMNSNDTQRLSNYDVEYPASTQVDHFVPSAYANELTESYMERSQTKVFQHEDIWTKLERQLQEKDKIIKERLLSKPQT